MLLQILLHCGCYWFLRVQDELQQSLQPLVLLQNVIPTMKMFVTACYRPSIVLGTGVTSANESCLLPDLGSLEDE